MLNVRRTHAFPGQPAALAALCAVVVLTVWPGAQPVSAEGQPMTTRYTTVDPSLPDAAAVLAGGKDESAEAAPTF